MILKDGCSAHFKAQKQFVHKFGTYAGEIHDVCPANKLIIDKNAGENAHVRDRP